jgi:hypothetical protein
MEECEQSESTVLGSSAKDDTLPVHSDPFPQMAQRYDQSHSDA